MIIFSRHRDETAFDREWAETLASQFRVLSIPFLYDLRSFGPTVQRLRTLAEPSCLLIPLPVRASEILLENMGIREHIGAVMDVSDATIEDILNFAGTINVPKKKGRYEHLDEPTVKRWYPVVDGRACIGCLECVNFCLFGVYSIGKDDRPEVDQPDACRDGCPACSRVCPAGAILFPMHADPVISGKAEVESDRDSSGIALAERERQRHQTPSDELDELIDEVDRFSL